MLSFLAQKQNIRSGDRCLSLQTDGKLILAKCNKNDNQLFDYVLNEDTGETYFKTYNGKCLEVGDINYITPKECKDRNNTNWKWLEDGHIKKFNIDDYCFKIDDNGFLIVGMCDKTKFNFDFTSYGQEYCKTNTDQKGCGSYGTFIQGRVSELYGRNPRLIQETTSFFLECQDTNIDKFYINNITGNIGAKCRGSDEIKFAINNDPHLNAHYYTPPVMRLTSNYGFNGAVVNADSFSYKTIYPFSPENPYTNNHLIENSSVFTCPPNQVITKIFGSHDNKEIKSIKLICDNINQQPAPKQKDLFYTNLILRLKSIQDISKFINYSEITNKEELGNINNIIALSKSGSNNIVVIKIIPTKMRYDDIQYLDINTTKCNNDVINWDIKTVDYNKIVQAIENTLSSFDPFIETIKKYDVKNVVTVPKFLPITKVSVNGFYLSIINCANMIIFIDDMIKDAITTNTNIYIVCYSSNVCFKNNKDNLELIEHFGKKELTFNDADLVLLLLCGVLVGMTIRTLINYVNKF